jgi:hypothetical protein
VPLVLPLVSFPVVLFSVVSSLLVHKDDRTDIQRHSDMNPAAQRHKAYRRPIDEALTPYLGVLVIPAKVSLHLSWCHLYLLRDVQHWQYLLSLAVM